jgi:hypothetical protein
MKLLLIYNVAGLYPLHYISNRFEEDEIIKIIIIIIIIIINFLRNCISCGSCYT